MSSSFIGSKIAIITRTQCRYVGTIIGIDAKASSILLGNVKCFGTENRGGNFANGSMVGTVAPVMQFANSEIEDLKIVDDEQTMDNLVSQQPSYTLANLSSPPQKQSSIHDDPAIVSAVVSSANKEMSMPNRLIHDLQSLTLSSSDEQSKKLSKVEDSRIRTDAGELSQTWSLLSPSNWDSNKASSQTQPLQTGNKSKFFDSFTLNNTTEQLQPNRSQQRLLSNTHSTQTSRHQDSHLNRHDKESDLPVRQPFFANDQPILQQQHRHQNGNVQHQRNFYSNRRTHMNNQQRRPNIGVGGNRETFNDNGNNYEDEFDFESNNKRFNKIASEEEFNQQTDIQSQVLQSMKNSNLAAEFEPIYDKKKSFFDNVTLEETTNASGPSYNRTRNQDTFGNDRNQRHKNRGGGSGIGGYRRSNNNYRQQQGNDDFYYRQNNNGYHYRY